MITRHPHWVTARTRGQCGKCVLEAAKKDAREKRTSIRVTKDPSIEGHHLIGFGNARGSFLSLKLPVQCECPTEGILLATGR